MFPNQTELKRKHHREYMYAYYWKNRDRIIANRKRLYPKNRAKAIARVREWERNNKDKILAWRDENAEYIRQRTKEYNKKNKELKKQKRKSNRHILREKLRQWRIKRREHVNAWAREYSKTEKNRERVKIYRMRENVRIRNRLRFLLWNSIRRYGEGKKFKSEVYGVNFKAIIEHLGCRPNDGRKYHIDHIRPLCSFDMKNPVEIMAAFAPENHQWLEASENIRKGGRTDFYV